MRLRRFATDSIQQLNGGGEHLGGWRGEPAPLGEFRAAATLAAKAGRELTNQRAGVENDVCRARHHNREGLPVVDENRRVARMRRDFLRQRLQGVRVGTLDMPDHLARIVSMLGGNPAAVTLEVTESCLVDDLSAFLDIATRLRLKGFRLAIDDFGTGFATLEQLSRLPVSELKVDREFVAGAPDNDRTRAILEASLQLARSLNLTTICEGVETRAEWNLAADLGADCIQGFYIAKPMAAGELVGWFNSWRMS